MSGRTISLFSLLLLTGLYLSPVHAADDIAADNSDSSSENTTISPNDNRIRSILNTSQSDNEILSAIQSGNTASIYQFGSNNSAQIEQQGSGNQAYSEQFGADNKSTIDQTGINNSAEQYQSGTYNNAISIQHGNNNLSRQIQYGNGLNSRVTQFGNMQILIRQGL